MDWMGQPHRSAPFTIRVIDDEPLILETVTELLQSEGHRVLSAASGEGGLMLARARLPDLILVDFHMSGITGLEVTQRLKADASTRRIPVVALTSATAEHANELSRAGTIGFIPKPFEPVDFLRLVADLLNATVARSRGRGDSRPHA